MVQTEGSHRFRDTTWFLIIHWNRPSGLDRTIVATPGTDIAQNQKRCRAGVPTFPPVRTTRFFADSVELEPLHGLLDIEIIWTSLGLDFKPGWKTGSMAG